MAVQSFFENPFGELAIEETLEDSYLGSDEILVETVNEKPMSCVTLLDCSFSMTGEKHLLGSIAVAVLLLEVSPKNSGVVVFSSQSKSIRKLGEVTPIENSVLGFLRHRPGGFTNIALGLSEGLRQFGSTRRRKLGLLVTDGRSTEGQDPIPLAGQFDYLVVLHLHGPGSHLESSKALSSAGHGVCLEVNRYEELPKKLYEAVRVLARL